MPIKPNQSWMIDLWYAVWSVVEQVYMITVVLIVLWYQKKKKGRISESALLFFERFYYPFIMCWRAAFKAKKKQLEYSSVSIN